MHNVSLFEKWPKTGALLFLGSESIAIEYARYLLCRLDTTHRNIALLKAGTHTDFYHVFPDDQNNKTAMIKIDQIRNLITWSSGTPQISPQKVAIISPADALNIQAQNALLKTLEEPPSHMVFILVSTKPSLIAPTIRSRCYWVRLKSENYSKAIDELIKDAKIIGTLEDLKTQKAEPVSIAAEWIKFDPKTLIDALLISFYQILKNQIPRNHSMWKFLDALFEAKKELQSPNPPNIQLLWESLLIQYTII